MDTELVDSEQLRRLVPTRAAIAAVKEAFAASARGEFSTVARVAAPSHSLFVMLCERIRPVDGVNLGQVVKVVSYHEDNPASHLPVVQGLVLWYDGRTGVPRLAIDGAAVTALRTGAASGVATELLAPATASSLALIGTGATARDQIDAVCAVRPITSIAVAGRDFAKTRAFVQALESDYHAYEIVACETAPEAVSGADVVCTATTARAPLFTLADVKPTAHINAIGAFSPHMCELGSDVLEAARIVCVDDRAALEDAGDMRSAVAEGLLEASAVSLLGDLLNERSVTRGADLTVFKSIGVARKTGRSRLPSPRFVWFSDACRDRGGWRNRCDDSVLPQPPWRTRQPLRGGRTRSRRLVRQCRTARAQL